MVNIIEHHTTPPWFSNQGRYWLEKYSNDPESDE